MAHQLTEKPLSAAVIGGVNADIWGRPSGNLILRDSNPGRVAVTPGGVGRNIAHDLRLLGIPVSLVAAFGDDSSGSMLQASCRENGIDISLSPVFSGRRSSTYLYITDAQGDMQLAVNDMDIVSELSPEFLEGILPELNRFSALVLDANLREDSIDFLCSRATVPLYADTVSTAKAGRLFPSLSRLRALKTNAAEAEALTGEASVEAAAGRLIGLGVSRVFISLGSKGILAADGRELLTLPAKRIPAINTNGAGDAAAAAAFLADRKGMCLRRCAEAALGAGAVTCCSPLSNPPELSLLTI